MLILKDRLLGVPIMSLQTGASIAKTESLVIDPRQLKAVAFYCNGPRLDIHPAVLVIEDIREFSRLGFIIDAADNLVAPSDLVRMGEVLHYNFILDNKPVIDETGRKVGRVVNYALDSTTFYVIKIHVRPGLLKSWKTAEILIDRTQIVEITDTNIVVKAPTIKQENQKPIVAGAPIIENPFSHPSAETAAPQKKR